MKCWKDLEAVGWRAFGVLCALILTAIPIYFIFASHGQTSSQLRQMNYVAAGILSLLAIVFWIFAFYPNAVLIGRTLRSFGIFSLLGIGLGIYFLFSSLSGHTAQYVFLCALVLLVMISIPLAFLIERSRQR